MEDSHTTPPQKKKKKKKNKQTNKQGIQGLILT